MKKILLFAWVILFCGCQNQNEVLVDEEPLQVQRMSDFQKYKAEARKHSDYLAYAFDHLRANKTRSSAPQTPDELYLCLSEITSSFAKEKLYLENDNSDEAEKFMRIIFSSDALSRTRTGVDVSPVLPSIAVEFFSRIDELPEQLDAEQFKKAVEGIVSSEYFLANSTDEEFLVVALAAAVCIDSYAYWAVNYPAWSTELLGTAKTRGFWSDVWTETKRLSKKDAEAAVIGTPGAIASGPLALNVLFASAGIGSVYAAFSPYL